MSSGLPPPPLPTLPTTTPVPLFPQPTSRIPQPFAKPHHHHHHHHNLAHLLLPIAGAVVFLSFLVFLFLFLLRICRSSLSTLSSSKATTPLRFSYSSLRRATSSFSPSRRLGQGGFGAVYSATLNTKEKEKTHAAVKLMDSGSLQGEREFHNEILMASKLVGSERFVKLLGFASDHRRRRMCLVYELMENGNLQECLLHKKPEPLMDWSCRFRIALDVALALAYLHHDCDPAIIHGDVKPSNVLLDVNFGAKIADFGLARFKLVDDRSASDLTQPDLVKASSKKRDHHVLLETSTNVNVEDTTGSIWEAESLTTITGFDEASVSISIGPVEDGSPDQGNLGLETCMIPFPPPPVNEIVGKSEDENGGILSSVKVKDYVMEWIGGSDQVKNERPNSDHHWIGASSSSKSAVGIGKSEKKKKKKVVEKRLEWWISMDNEQESTKKGKGKRKKVREWWKEEYVEELERKRKKKKKKKKKRNESNSTTTDQEDNRFPAPGDDDDDDDVMYHEMKKSRVGKSSRSRIDWWLDGLRGPGGEIQIQIPKSGGGGGGGGLSISSTPSMRGTVCYIAPEYSAGGDLSEKCDVYSYGVLLLVLVAGRRPLQVTPPPPPMVSDQYQRANLISWARRLARKGKGKLLDLVDNKIRSLNREQAQLCIILALLCLHKSPRCRPSMKEVVGILTGEMQPPVLPTEFSPSPTSRFPFKSQNKARRVSSPR
ncbi:hypothetical protein Dimus_028283 [Dionaea muscipula]